MKFHKTKILDHSLYTPPPLNLFSGKKVQIRKPAPALSDIAPLRRTSRPVLISSSTVKKGTTQHRPLRERLIHLLALKPYKKPELILRLQKDGLSLTDKDSLDSHLQQVTHPHPSRFIAKSVFTVFKPQGKKSGIFPNCSVEYEHVFILFCYLVGCQPKWERKHLHIEGLSV